MVGGAREAGGHWGSGESWGVGGGLGAEVGQVKVRTGFVANVHRLAELAFGPEAVEDDGVDGDDENLDYDFDDAADESPVLHTTDKAILHVVFKQGAPLVIDTSPAPHILVVVAILAVLENCCSDCPYDDTESEEEYREDGVINTCLLSSFVASFPVTVEHSYASYQG